jgi:hypothetical protein
MREREVAAAKPVPGKESTYLWDDKVRGLALRVRAGSKTLRAPKRVDLEDALEQGSPSRDPLGI